jgi:hypothetical protein
MVTAFALSAAAAALVLTAADATEETKEHKAEIKIILHTSYQSLKIHLSAKVVTKPAKNQPIFSPLFSIYHISSFIIITFKLPV